MTFDTFQRHLTSGHRSASTGRPLGPHAAGDYPSRLRRLEDLLQTPLETAPPMVLRSLAEELRNDPRVIAAVPRKVIGDIAVALRAYASFRDNPSIATTPGFEDAGPSLGSDTMIAELRALGFVAMPTGSKKIIELSRGDLTLYARLDAGSARLDAGRPIVIHPAFEESHSTLAHLTGMVKNERIEFYHNLNLSKFPRRDNGRGLTHYGIAFGFVSGSVHGNFIGELENALGSGKPLAPENELRGEIRAVETEAIVLAKARIGQGRFRADLLNFWQGQCALTGVAAPELLRASHIKAWRDSNNRERLDVFNGILLAVHLDTLFDRALITFQDSGEMLVSKTLPAKERDVFGLASPARRLLLNVSHLAYLHRHRDRFGANEQKYRRSFVPRGSIPNRT